MGNSMFRFILYSSEDRYNLSTEEKKITIYNRTFSIKYLEHEKLNQKIKIMIVSMQDFKNKRTIILSYPQGGSHLRKDMIYYILYLSNVLNCNIICYNYPYISKHYNKRDVLLMLNETFKYTKENISNNIMFCGISFGTTVIAEYMSYTNSERPCLLISPILSINDSFFKFMSSSSKTYLFSKDNDWNLEKSKMKGDVMFTLCEYDQLVSYDKIKSLIDSNENYFEVQLDKTKHNAGCLLNINAISMINQRFKGDIGELDEAFIEELLYEKVYEDDIKHMIKIFR